MTITLNKTNRNYKKSQTGRSMVEMLGVLAIVGVLSVGGVYGYGVAMKKHKANELLHQASMLATTISAQAMSNDGILPSTITSFGNTNYGTFSTTATEALDGKGFSIEISNLDGSICNQLKKGGMIRNVTCDPNAKKAIITYYKNLATTEAEGKNSPTGGSGSSSFNPSGATKDDDGAECSGTRPGDCSVCLSTGESTAHWYDSDALCTEPGQTCVDGTCETSAAETPNFTSNMCKCLYSDFAQYDTCSGDEYAINCYSDADCVQYGTWDATQEKCVVETFCTNNSDCSSDEYCHYTSLDYATCKPNKKGTCVAKVDAKGDFATGTTAEADGFIRSSVTMDWFSAQNFCRSYGKNLVTLDQMDLGNAVPSGQSGCEGYSGTEGCQIDDWSAIRRRFGTDFEPWTANLVPGSSCNVFAVYLSGSLPQIGGYNNRKVRYEVLCR